MSAIRNRAFSHPLITKDFFLSEMRQHKAADRFEKGTYWDYEGGKGCAVGCAIESISKRLQLTDLEHGDHELYEIYLGIPERVALLEDRIFENLPHSKAFDWPIRFAESIAPGADLSQVEDQYNEHPEVGFAFSFIRENPSRAADILCELMRAAPVHPDYAQHNAAASAVNAGG